MRLCLLIERFLCAGGGRSFGHCAGVASAARMGFAWWRRGGRCGWGDERLGRGKSITTLTPNSSQFQPRLDSATGAHRFRADSGEQYATGNLIDIHIEYP